MRETSVHTIRADPKNLIYKFRYVAKGYSQIYGIDYFEIFARTAIAESVRILMQLVVNFDSLLHQMDVKSAYLHAPIKLDVYIYQSPGFEKLDKNSNELVCKLNESLYDLKKNQRNWCNLLYNFLIELCFVQSKQTVAFSLKIMKRELLLLSNMGRRCHYSSKLQFINE